MDDLSSKKKKTDLELELLIQAIKRCYGWDFSNYKKASLKRRVESYVENQQLDNISDLISKTIYDQNFFENFIHAIPVPVTEMFRDPKFYAYLRQQVLPILATYPYIKIWHAGCASGEEVYSTAIMLDEESLLDKTRIYGTDINDQCLDKANHGAYKLQNIQSYNNCYKESGGKGDILDFFNSSYDNALVKTHIKKHLAFFNHNLSSDKNFGQMHMILCRNVYIYFEQNLQDHATSLFLESLIPGGFLCLGTKETLSTSKYAQYFELLDNKLKIYRKLYD